MKAVRHNKGKVPLSYIFDFPTTLAGVSKVMEQGAEKYGRDNWKGGQPSEWYLDSCLRHLMKWKMGQAIDSESHLPHLLHAAVNLMMLTETELKVDYYGSGTHTEITKHQALDDNQHC